MSLVGELPALLACYALTTDSPLIPEVFPVPGVPFSRRRRASSPRLALLRAVRTTHLKGLADDLQHLIGAAENLLVGKSQHHNAR